MTLQDEDELDSKRIVEKKHPVTFESIETSVNESNQSSNDLLRGYSDLNKRIEELKKIDEELRKALYENTDEIEEMKAELDMNSNTDKNILIYTSGNSTVHSSKKNNKNSKDEDLEKY